jgi:hypothetical protein
MSCLGAKTLSISSKKLNRSAEFTVEAHGKPRGLTFQVDDCRACSFHEFAPVNRFLGHLLDLCP